MENKMETCKFRSDTVAEYGPSCCASKRSVGYYCLERGIHGLTDEVCNSCELYASKTQESEQVD